MCVWSNNSMSKICQNQIPYGKAKLALTRFFMFCKGGYIVKLKLVIRNTWLTYMSGNHEPTHARNTTFEAKQCEGKSLADLGHKMAKGGYFQGFL